MKRSNLILVGLLIWTVGYGQNSSNILDNWKLLREEPIISNAIKEIKIICRHMIQSENLKTFMYICRTETTIENIV